MRSGGGSMRFRCGSFLDPFPNSLQNPPSSLSCQSIFIIQKSKNMKYLMIAMLFTFGFFSTSCAQKQVAPAAVQSAFKAKFPSVQKAKWEEEHEGEWEAEFKMGGKELSAVFDNDGAWVETETEIKAADLPEAVQSAVSAQFSDYDIEEAAMVETPGQAMAYEVELEKEGEATIEALFSADGTLIRQMSETEEDDDND